MKMNILSNEANRNKSWPVKFKNVKVMKIKDRLKNCSRLKETKEIRQLNAMCDFELAIKDIIWIIGET